MQSPWKSLLTEPLCTSDGRPLQRGTIALCEQKRQVRTAVVLPKVQILLLHLPPSKASNRRAHTWILGNVYQHRRAWAGCITLCNRRCGFSDHHESRRFFCVVVLWKRLLLSFPACVHQHHMSRLGPYLRVAHATGLLLLRRPLVKAYVHWINATKSWLPNNPTPTRYYWGGGNQPSPTRALGGGALWAPLAGSGAESQPRHMVCVHSEQWLVRGSAPPAPIWAPLQ